MGWTEMTLSLSSLSGRRILCSLARHHHSASRHVGGADTNTNSDRSALWRHDNTPQHPEPDRHSAAGIQVVSSWIRCAPKIGASPIESNRLNPLQVSNWLWKLYSPGKPVHSQINRPPSEQTSKQLRSLRVILAGGSILPAPIHEGKTRFFLIYSVLNIFIARCTITSRALDVQKGSVAGHLTRTIYSH